MLELLPAPAPHVVAFRLGGRLTGSEVERVFGALDAALAEKGTINLYIEITGLSGLTLEALVKDTAKSLGLLGRLGRFGRYAVVTDTRWIRTAAGIEDKLIPGLEIRTFPLVESEAAKAWVMSRSA